MNYSLGSVCVGSRELVIFDGNIDDIQQLIDAMKPGIDWEVLNPHQDGIEQITRILANYPGIETLHIVSHGAPGCLFLGNTQLSLETIKQYTNDLQSWSASDILLYGCKVAAGDAGVEFLAKIQALTKANIAASANLTGNDALGGDWELEVSIGKINTALGFSSEALEAYSGVLGKGEGLVAHYYNNTDRSGSPAIVKIDNLYDYQDWGTGNPNNGNNPLDQWDFSADWQGAIVAPETGWYYFRGRADDWLRLQINGSNVIGWKNLGELDERTGSIYLEKNNKYDINISFEDTGDQASINLDWKRPSSSYWGNIPTRYLSPDTNRYSSIYTSVPTVSIEPIGESSNGKAEFRINSSHIPTFADGSRGITVYYRNSQDSSERSLTLTQTSQTIQLDLSSSSLSVSLQSGAYILGDNDSAEIFKNW